MTRPVAVISRRFRVSDGGSTPLAREAAQAEVLAPGNVPTMILCETRGLLTLPPQNVSLSELF